MKKQISSIGVILPVDYNVSFPPKIVPIVFFGNKLGSELKTIIETQTFVFDNFEHTPDYCSELVFIRRNYDGSELFYFVNCFTYDELDKFRIFIKDQKGGILL